MIVIGLTGGIASGKTTAARHLVGRGGHLVDADRLGHRAYEPGTAAQAAVAAAFGEDVIGADGRVDRKMLGQRVFASPEALRRLTDIVWPEIKRLAFEAIATIREADPGAIVVLDAAVLLEAGWEDIVDEIWVVTVDRAIAVTRAMARDSTDEAAVQARIEAQLTNAERAARADVVIDNGGDEAALKAALDTEWERLAAAR